MKFLVKDRKTEKKYVYSLTSMFDLCIELAVISQTKGVSCAPRKWPSSSQMSTVDQTTFGFIPSIACWHGGK